MWSNIDQSDLGGIALLYGMAYSVLKLSNSAELQQRRKIMMTLEQSQKPYIATIYDTEDTINFTPSAIVCSDKEFDLDDVKIDNDTQTIRSGFPVDPSFNWEAACYSGLEIIDLDDPKYKDYV